MATEEKRLYPRLALQIEDGYFGHFSLPDDDHLAALIVNLSAGGINVAVAESEGKKIKEGDIVELKQISGGTNFSFLKDLHAEIRWIKNLEIAGYISAGFRFIEISEELREQLSGFVHSERMTRGQYD